MRPKLDADATTAEKALKLYQKLLLDGRRHYQRDLAEWLNCSPQTIIRLIADIESVAGACLVSGLDKRRRWYQIKSVSRNRLGLDFEELRYLAICRDLAAPYLPEEVKERVEHSLFNFSMLMADQEFAEREKIQKNQFAYCAKGWIDYSPFFGILEKLVEAVDENKVCLVRYKAPGGQIREHRLAPRRLVAMNNALYVLGAGLTEDFAKVKHLICLAIHRIQAATLTDRTTDFRIPAENLDMFGLPWHGPQKFRIKFRAGKASDYVEERHWSIIEKKMRDEDGGLILEMVSRGRPEVEAWVRSFGEHAELVSIEDYNPSEK
ncbi:MAG: WYL domain-containing protein [Desulfovibrio sp.]|nr:WYL domain-containing protein [Desulfovibrio sp.]